MLPENARPLLEELLQMPAHKPLEKKLGEVSPRALGLRRRTEPMSFAGAYKYVRMAVPNRRGVSAQTNLMRHLKAIAWIHGVREAIQQLKPRERSLINTHLEESQGALPRGNQWTEHTHDRRKSTEGVLTEMAA
ncbi:MAG TPA: hypothetical protein VI874_01535, partial [Candidatus Norongarragalinales archaeon]|nr:hypothetical protein [Candidatus Norongarragalinales archaeon]